MNYGVFLLLLVIGFPFLQGQPYPVYEPLEVYHQMPTAMRSEMLRQLDRAQQAQESWKKREQKQWNSFVNERFEYTEQNFKAGHYLNDSFIQNYLDSVLQVIISNNPVLENQTVRVLVSRYSTPNASCLGEGTLVINTGLLRRLQDESQLAFVLCHELAHYYLDHVNTAAKRRIVKMNSKAVQKELKTLKRQEFNQYSQSLDLLRNLTYHASRHSRYNETAADSIGVKFLSNTPYDFSAAERCLALLDSVDQEKYPAQISFKKWFHHSEYPFQDDWLPAEVDSDLQPTTMNFANWHLDSLKTHPDCPERVKAVEGIVSENKGQNKFLQSKANFERMVWLSDFDLIQAAYDAKAYGRSLYLNLLLLEQYPQDPFLQSMVGKCFFELHQYQKNHVLSKVLAQPDQRFSASYNRFLSFVHKLRLKEMAHIAYFFMENRTRGQLENEDFLYAYTLVNFIKDDSERFKELKSQYQKTFPDGRFIRSLNNIQN